MIGIGFWSFSGKNVSFFGNPNINIESEVDMDLDLDLEHHQDLPSGLNNASYGDNAACPIVVMGGVIAYLVAIFPFPRYFSE